MPRKICVRGGVGDTFLNLLHIMGEGESVEVVHPTTRNAYRQDQILDLYSLSPLIKKVSVVESPPPEMARTLLDFYDKQSEYFEQFPKLTFPESKQKPEGSYVCVQPRSGHEEDVQRTIPPRDLERIKAEEKLPLVFIGEDRGTTILEASGLVSQCARFYAASGYFSFLALSQRIPTIVWCYTRRDYLAFRHRLAPGWLKYVVDIHGDWM